VNRTSYHCRPTLFECKPSEGKTHDFVWRGWGPLGLVVLIPPLVSCVGLLDWNPVAACAAFGLMPFAGGFACRQYGRKWNRGTGRHMMYWVALETWGLVYMILGGLYGVLGSAALVKKAVMG
jgi:hypothetical protein